MTTIACPAWCTDHYDNGTPEDEVHRTEIEIGSAFFGSVCQSVRNPEPVPLLFVEVQIEGAGAETRQCAASLVEIADRYDAIVDAAWSGHGMVPTADGDELRVSAYEIPSAGKRGVEIRMDECLVVLTRDQVRQLIDILSAAGQARDRRLDPAYGVACP
jgi:alkanesulfonate monooxygenase SsuD/methylene tetrahydromethanopterin reductase-like flavin-dependent oxidoreductase (luciferase family)